MNSIDNGDLCKTAISLYSWKADVGETYFRGTTTVIIVCDLTPLLRKCYILVAIRRI